MELGEGVREEAGELIRGLAVNRCCLRPRLQRRRRGGVAGFKTDFEDRARAGGVNGDEGKRGIEGRF